MNLSVPNVIVFLILICSPHLSVCQNCGVPRYVFVKQSDILTETMDTGQILTTVPAANVEKIRNFTKNPADFANLRLELQILILEVKNPFWTKLNPNSKSYIDAEMVQEVEISAILQCSDGQTKEITFRLPIVDENTELPRFEQLEYNLKAEPCVSGRCVLAFETEIFIIDEDRDEVNAEVEISTDCKEIEVLTNLITIEPWYSNPGNSDGRLHKGFQTKVKLAFAPHYVSREKSISFTIMAKNTKEQLMHEVIYTAESHITITFEEFPDRILPPIFSSSFYYAHVKSFGEMVKVEPQEIFADIPWDNDSDTNNIIYKFSGNPDPSIFLMDSNTGQIKFDSNLDETSFEALRNSEVTFRVTAERIKKLGDGESIQRNTASSSASFLVFFSNLIEDPTNGTTEYPCSPECYTTPTPTPFPGTCPITTCPTPDPCPETTTVFPTTFAPDPPSTANPTIPPETTTSRPSTIKPSTTPPQTSTYSEPSTTDVTETSEYTSSTIEPTTEPHESTTTEEVTEAPIEESDATTEFTTKLTSLSTSTTPTTTTTFYPTVTPSPGNCTCSCNDKFSCEEPETTPSKNSTEYYEYPDPYNCTRYHRCTNESDDSFIKICPHGKVYCPKNAACETVNDCVALYNGEGHGWWWKVGYGGGYLSSEESDEDTCEECECDRTDPGENGNLCEKWEFNGSNVTALEDPTYCDIFHKCVSNDQGGYYDYRMKCQVGLIFCKEFNSCTWPNQGGCYCPSYKKFKQCDVCKMGNWKLFDIFKLKFVKGRDSQ